MYIIVGIKVAHGGVVSLSHRHGKKAGADVGPLGLSALGVPLDGNISLSANAKEAVAQFGYHPEDFIFAYRLRKCNFTRQEVGLQPKFYTKGATMHHIDTDDAGTEVENGSIEDTTASTQFALSSEGLFEQDVNAKMLKLRNDCVRSASDEGGCSCIVVTLAQTKK